MTDRVFVTGMGIVSALGTGIDATLRALLKEESGIGKISHLETSLRQFPVGEVKLTNSEMSQLLNVGSPHNRLRTVLMGILAAKEAMDSASLSEKDLNHAAFISGTTVGGMDNTERFFNAIIENGARSDEAKELDYNDCGSSTTLMAEKLGRFKTVTTASTACSSAANAVVLGANMIKAGMVDIAVVGGSEALTRFHLNGFNTLMILNQEKCRPFDVNRNGINLGEGAAFIVLESERSARMRNVKPIASLAGYANACDAFHQTASSDNGEGAYLSMTGALKMAGLQPNEIDYVNSHGTGTHNNDASEVAAMSRIWHDKSPSFSSTKAFTGHTTSASGSIETVISLLAMQNDFLPANLGCDVPLNQGYTPVLKTQAGVEINNVLVNSFGFGGNDTTLIFSKTEDNEP